MRDALIITSDGVRISYQVSEEAKAAKKMWLVLIHGMGGDSNAWKDEVVWWEKKGFGCVAVDLRGQGLSGRPDDFGSYAIERMAQDIEEVIAAEELKEFVVVGHCLGGMVALAREALSANKASRLVLVNMSFRTPYLSNRLVNNRVFRGLVGGLSRVWPEKKKFARRDFGRFKGTRDVDVVRFVSDVRATSVKSYLALARQLTGVDLEELLGKVGTPALVIHGKEDIVVPVRTAEELCRGIPGCRLELVPGQNHVIVINNPDVVAEKVAGFVGTV